MFLRVIICVKYVGVVVFVVLELGVWMMIKA